jgi:hypothetical protein
MNRIYIYIKHIKIGKETVIKNFEDGVSWWTAQNNGKDNILG